ncbi:ATP-dependent DNA helicase [Rhodococcus sp. IEGM 1408]|uniref:ATP-dependent DNA helicase n=1 Tax=Rhodococcus sp. IEGM 1408 TaxID=3082220 RepID=UPI00295406CE|nr:ATP-dependent DNA helicase [Rhodococcus sp. IEGM 1408]MDV8000811.1 ATP-dependent DNA helicase [Rhodococcus sp. IEGM 1408]
MTDSLPPVSDLLATAVESLGGSERSGQVTMAEAVGNALSTGEHLAVQAGTGTGKSLAYLVPSLRHAVSTGKTVVVSTATIALQNQLVDRDLPRLAAALKPQLGVTPSHAILKGRGNYLCLHRVGSGPVDEVDPEEVLTEELFDLPLGGESTAARPPRGSSSRDTGPDSRLGQEISRLYDWAQETDTGDRDDLPRGVSDAAWRQVSVTSRECLGQLCPHVTECFAELAKQQAGRADVVVTNHALLAIDAMTDVSVLPEHDAVVIDEAHELSDRVTGVTTAELTGAAVIQAARRAAKLVDQQSADRMVAAGEGLAGLLELCPEGRWDLLPEGADLALAAVRQTAEHCRSAVPGPKPGEASGDPQGASDRQKTLAALDEIAEAADRMLSSFERPVTERLEIVWMSEEDRRGRILRVAPLSVAGLLRARLFAESTVILTSATLTTGGKFDGLAATWGLPSASSARPDPATAVALEPPSDDDASSLRWTGLDAGSPFDYRRNGILYVASHLPAPGREGASPEAGDELVDLVTAAGGRTLGLFSSMRGAKAAAELLRGRLDTPVLCQGDDSTANLVRKFAADEQTTLVGTLSLWQGVDVPGRSLSLVVIDRIPFPRPDDPLLSARQRAVGARGGNGFLAVAGNHAALLLAQGVGRLLRRTDDRGVVAVLDSRLVTARYGGYLRASLPPFWQTTNRDVAIGALERLRDA